MIMIANFQFGRSVLVLPLQNAHGWAVSPIQVAFTIFVALETWWTPINGWIADGPRVRPSIVMGITNGIATTRQKPTINPLLPDE